MLSTTIPRFQTLMLSKSAFTSRYSLLVVIALHLVAANLQQVMSLEHGHKSRSSPQENSHIISNGDAFQRSESSPKCWKTMDERNRFPSAIVKHLLIPDWLCILLLVFAGYFAHTSSRLQIDLEENQKNSIVKLHAMEDSGKAFKISVDQQRSSLQSQNRSLIQENAKLKSELSKLRSLISSLDSNLVRDAAKAKDPVSKVPADNMSKQKSAAMASVPNQRVPSSASEHNQATAFMTAVVDSTSEIVPKKVVSIGKGSQEKQSTVSKKVTKHGGIFKKENRDVRPVPGSSSFVRAKLIDTSTAQVKKLLSGDYLTLYMGNLSYRANDLTLKTAIEKRLPITVDQAVVAYSSDGRSRGCAFVTVRWKEYLKAFSDPNSQSLVQKFCHSLTGKPLFGRPVFVELACNQRRGG